MSTKKKKGMPSFRPGRTAAVSAPIPSPKGNQARPVLDLTCAHAWKARLVIIGGKGAFSQLAS